MKKIKIGIKSLLIMLMVLCGLFAGKTVLADTSSSVQANFIQQLSPIVKSVSKKYNLYASIMMAQAALESDWGQSQLAVQANNYFGMKGSYNGQSISMPTAEYNSNGQLYYTNANFKKYPNVYDSIDDNGNLLRNGTSWDNNYYSGSHKENAATFEDAAKSLVGKYATSPQYANLLINLINQYGWSNLDQTINQIVNDANHPKHHKNKKKHHPKAVYAKVKLTEVDPEKWSLSSNYQREQLYRDIPNTKKRVVKSPWINHNSYAGQKVYVDAIAQANFKKKTTTWYRLRFKNSNRVRKYWVSRPALNLPKITYYKIKTSLLINHQDNEVIYNHVMGDPALARPVSNTNKLSKNQYMSNYMAIVNDNGSESIWYRIRLNKHRNGWGNANYLFNNKRVQYINDRSKRNLNNHYGEYDLYEHIPGTRRRIKTFKWAEVGNQVKNNTVNSNLLAIRNAYQSIWVRIMINHRNYWISQQAFN
ncbi:autolysin [Philodulcilactobacillus myokoensis]|uniref:Autolysin n=1 Tax=Philodulcilactobacillus myokoensis TaxID=2929573 RepID=A0A9W6B1E0_9LACO|nr:glycoside hydrolase family 73 protein [Philodulcilactobacillus myokoensis]GLB47110.1 autolysin [Philodulcilactobacillus myokoensis]